MKRDEKLYDDFNMAKVHLFDSIWENKMNEIK